MGEINLPEGIISEEDVLPFKDFCLLCNLEEQYVIEMVEMGILIPEGKQTTNWQFSVIQLLRVKKAQRLQADLKINLAGVALSLDLLDEINELRKDIKKLEHQVKLLTQLL